MRFHSETAPVLQYNQIWNALEICTAVRNTCCMPVEVKLIDKGADGIILDLQLGILRYGKLFCFTLLSLYMGHYHSTVVPTTANMHANEHRDF